MATEVRLPTLLRAATDGKASVVVDGDTVGGVLKALESAHPGLAGQLLTPDGDLHKFVNVYLNDDDVRYLERLETVGSPGTELEFAL